MKYLRPRKSSRLCTNAINVRIGKYIVTKSAILKNVRSAKMAETLRQKQTRFAWLFAKLIVFANSAGYEITLGETFRTFEQAAANAVNGTGIANSLHCIRLAGDINLFRNGKYLKKTESYKILGDWWTSQATDCCWGGDFKGKNAGDAGHFSISHNGIK